MIDIERKISAVSYNNKNMPLAIQEKEIQPTTEEQVITGDDGYNLSKVTIKAVTKDIDSNIQSQNIKNGITILGVTGVLAGNKLPDVLNKTVTTLTAGDLIGTTQIPRFAFENCENLNSIEIPNTLTTIGEYAFNNCSNLQTINITEDNQIQSIENSAFRYTGITSIDLGKCLNLNSLKEGAFAQCEQLVSIGDFSKCVNLTEIASAVFAYCKKLEQITLPNTIKTIKGTAISYCYGLLEFIIPSSVTKIETYAFMGCFNLNKVVYLGQAPEIMNGTFSNCYNITQYDFRNCTTVPTLASTASLIHASGCQIIIPDALYDEWTTATNWVSLTNVVWVKASEVSE